MLETSEEEKKEKYESIDKKAKEITLDKFRYWLVVPFIFEKMNYDFWKRAMEMDLPDDHSLIQYCFDTGISRTSMISLFNTTENKDFEEIYVVQNEFNKKKNFIIAFAKLNGTTTLRYINESNRRNLWNLQNDLFLNIQSSKIFGTEIENILGKNPILLYIEPVEDNLANEISPIMEMLQVHENNWSIIYDFCLCSFKYWSSPWNKLIFINTKKIGLCGNRINIPDLFLDILKQVTSYELLQIYKNRLNKSALSNFDLQSLTTIKSIEQTSELHLRLMSALGEFSKYHILLTEELPKLRGLNKSFLKYLENFKNAGRIEEPKIENWLSTTICGHLENDVSTCLDLIEQDMNKLSSKAKILSSFSQDKLNSEISIINLKLQKTINSLTKIIAVLTFLLFLESDIAKNILSFVWRLILLIWDYLKP